MSSLFKTKLTRTATDPKKAELRIASFFNRWLKPSYFSCAFLWQKCGQHKAAVGKEQSLMNQKNVAVKELSNVLDTDAIFYNIEVFMLYIS